MENSSDSAKPAEPSIWPSNQVISRWADTEIMFTQFTDLGEFFDDLMTTVMARASDPALSHDFGAKDSLNATKVYGVEKWQTPASDLLNQRALALFGRFARNIRAEVDASWASVYRQGNFVMPHSHPLSIASVLFMLEPGGPTDNPGGQFLFVDPRLKPCCRQQPGFMSTPSAPTIKAGTMVMFPGKAVHMVTPYFGTEPRITFSWDLKPAGTKKTAVPKQMIRPK